VPSLPRQPAVRFVARSRTPRAVRYARCGRAALLATGVLAAALMLAPTAAHAADRYRVEITNLRSGLKADVMWASTARFQGVFLWPNNTSASQEFDLLDSGGGWFRIRARHSGQCLMLDWRGGPYKNGTRVVQSLRCSAGYAPGEWRRGEVGSALSCDGGACSSNGATYPVLINRRTGRCLDAANPSSAAPPRQAVLQQWRCIHSADDWNAGNQLWSIGNEGGYL
jgi:hypothetical protein